MRAKLDEPSSRWFRVLNSCFDPRARVVCFPHAGGSASFFRTWGPLMPPGVELLAARYPGREDRLPEAAAETMLQLVEPLARGCSGLLDKPLAFFGHSMGASVAYEVAVHMQEASGSAPELLFLSARSGPGKESKGRRLADACDDELMADITLLGGTQAPAFQDPELRELILPAIRADYRLIERYEASRSVIDVPIVTYFGDADPDVDQDGISAWAPLTRTYLAQRSFEGGHFYLTDCVQELIDDIIDRFDSSTVRDGTRQGAFLDSVPSQGIDLIRGSQVS